MMFRNEYAGVSLHGMSICIFYHIQFVSDLHFSLQTWISYRYDVY